MTTVNASAVTEPRTPAVRRVISTEFEHKWQLDVGQASPPGLLAAEVFERHLHALTDPLTVSQSTMYVDDAEFSLARAGHALGCIVNTGRASDIAWLRLKQTVLWDGRRDCLEIAERVDPGRIGQVINDPAVLPVGHVRRYGMAQGPLVPAGVLTQIRHKRTGSLHGLPSWVTFSIDEVEFRAPRGGIAPLRRYACLEVEVDDSDPDVLAGLDTLAADLDELLGHDRREKLTKGQLACLAAHPDRLTEQQLVTSVNWLNAPAEEGTSCIP